MLLQVIRFFMLAEHWLVPLSATQIQKTYLEYNENSYDSKLHAITSWNFQ